MMDRFWKWIAGLLPAQLVFWAAVRALDGQVTEQGIEVQGNLEIVYRLRRWQERSREYPLRMRSRGSKSIYFAEGWGLHVQNLNERKDKSFGSILKHGRAFLHLGERKTITPYWSFGGRWCMADIGIGGGDSGRDLAFTLGIPLVGYFSLRFERFLPEKLTPGRWMESYNRPGELWRMPEEREIGFSIHHGTIWISLWENPMESSGKDPWWWKFNWTPADTFFGHTKHTERDLSITDSVVSLPEGDYPVKVRMFESTWKRPRWPWSKKLVRAEVEPVDEHGIPAHAGKGENSWDLDDDFIFSLTTVAAYPAEAVQKFIDSVLHDREKYGQPDCLRANE